jgi:hypothetical protein
MNTQDDRHRPLASRRDHRSTVLAVLTVVEFGGIVGLGFTKFPALNTALEWAGYAGGAILLALQALFLVHSFRRRRRGHPPVPPAAKPKTEDERAARSLLGDLLMDHPDRGREGREAKDLHERLGDEIRHAEELFFFLRGENNAAAEEFYGQLVRIIAGGDASALDGYVMRSFDV